MKPITTETLSMTLLQFFETVYIPRRLLGKSERTKTLYRCTIKKFSQWLGRDATLADLTDDCVATYLDYLLGAKCRPHSVDKERSQLLAMWRLAAGKRMVGEFPEVSRITLPEIIPCAWTEDQLRRLVLACRVFGLAQRSTFFGINQADWWQALILVLWDSAERISAVLRSRWVDFDGEHLTFPAQNRKGGRRPTCCSRSASRTSRSRSSQSLRSRRNQACRVTSFQLLAGQPTNHRGRLHNVDYSVFPQTA